VVGFDKRWHDVSAHFARTIWFFEVPEGSKEIVMSVIDRGPGISKEQAAHIGEPFYRGDPSRARTSGGTGLGLYLATLIAKAHHGDLRLLDTGGKGASFEVRIPRADP
jgi:two-component system OmpR family sensor kinase